jgi:glucose-6-phosphate 1-epimerase
MPTSAITLSDFHGQPALTLVAGDGARACILLHGAHLVSWVPAGGEEQLYLSPQAVFDALQPVRGGVPVIFPQFNQRGPLPRHGFARTRAWRALSLVQGEQDAMAVLRLVDDDATWAIWPQRFVAELSVRIAGARIDIELAVEHREPEEAGPPAAEMVFTAALHTYVRVADATAARLDGLQRLRYEDSVRNTQQVDMAPQLTVAGELDRIYFDAARPLVLHDGPRRIEIASSGFADVVVWNPGAAASARFVDMPADGWREMLCVEAAAIGTPLRIPVGDCWIGRQSLTVLEPSGTAPPDAG